MFSGASWSFSCGGTASPRVSRTGESAFMQRNPARLSSEDYEVLVVGGGIYGACTAWEAAKQGLRVALIDAGDFGGATSSNSLRTLHGGLRHLQRLDFPRMRESIRSRREWLRLAPH